MTTYNEIEFHRELVDPTLEVHVGGRPEWTGPEARPQLDSRKVRSRSYPNSFPGYSPVTGVLS